MPSAEREKRHRHNFHHVTTHTAQEWAETFVRYTISRLIFSPIYLKFVVYDEGGVSY
jgi:hypothetical protein